MKKLGKGCQVIATIFFTLFFATSSIAWGPTGHKTVAYIAEDHLTAKTKQKVYDILGLHDDQDLATYVTWADDVRTKPKYKKTVSWHYINYDVRTENKSEDYVKYRENGNDVITQVQKEIEELKTTNDPDKQKEDLKFLIHFIGDINCPVHCVDDQDKGGNLKIVKLYKPDGTGRGNKMKLHAVWDRMIEFKNEEDPRTLATSLEKGITKADINKWKSGSPTDWAFESYKIAKDKIYKDFPNSGPTTDTVVLPQDYYSKMRPISDEQIEKAGIRLAATLNQIYDHKK
jgi:hypothetical protein